MSDDEKMGEVVDLEERKRRLTEGPDWLSQITDNNGKPRCNVAAVLVALREDENLRDCFGYDEMARETVLVEPLLGQDNKGCTVTDDNVIAVQEYLQNTYGMHGVRDTTINSAIDRRAHECAFHPIRDELRALEWDGTYRLRSWLSEYLGVTPSAYASAVGQMFAISMIARVEEPGCKADYMLILEGQGQGEEKSKICKILAGDQYFCDDVPGNDVAAYMAMNGHWIMEWSELHTFSVKAVEHLKAFITRTVNVYRRPYGRRIVHEPRQCVLIGTTNRTDYLTDPTGNRRFWPTEVAVEHPIDLGALERDRDQLLAEAYHLYKEGARWWPNAEFEAEHIKPEQDARREVDPWHGLIHDYLADKNEVYARDVFSAVGMDESRTWNVKEARRIGNVICLDRSWIRAKDGNGDRIFRRTP